MINNPKRIKWLAGAVAAVSCCAILAGLGSSTGDSISAKRPSTPASAELARTVHSANAAAETLCVEQVGVYRSYLRSECSTQYIRKFVDELLSLSQKAAQGVEFVNGANSDNRVRTLLRKWLVHEQQLAAAMEATVEAYERALVEQDRRILQAAGMPPDAWAKQFRATRPDISHWKHAWEPVVSRAISEARKDAARFVATTVAGDLAGSAIKGIARSLGFDTTERGGLADSITGFGADVAASAAIDHLTDATDDIVARMREEISRTEHSLLDGEHGLVAALQRTKAAHLAARQSILRTVQGR